ncbi:MAG: mechanosensitive ion channel family protein [Chroococcidiopsidaceae cyanobacterium CP_BM_RX_35]|nr:mechanosensitive ion channel family protein [Chroococcidiopsidaceae cyanobacterium CP_BM_RX_35]
MIKTSFPWLPILLGLLYTFVTSIVLYVLFKLGNRVFSRISNKLQSLEAERIPSIRIQNLELLSSSQITGFLLGLVKTTRQVINFLFFYLYILLVLSFFPQTKQYGSLLSHYLLSALVATVIAIVSYVPNIFSIALIIFATSYIIRLVKLIFSELEKGNISFSWFYREWISPTYYILVILIFSLAIVLVFPYLPGSHSPAFQGVSIFLGILLSLGSTGAVTSIVSGIILIYNRAFSIGDRVKIADTIGDVVEKTLLATHVRTENNTVITIPNSQIVNNPIINFSTAARNPSSPPLNLSTKVTFGYELSWRRVHEVLIAAAHATPGVLADPSPYVENVSLDVFYVTYELNVYIDNPKKMSTIYSELHKNILDNCNEVGFELLSPHRSSHRGHQL